MAMAMRAAEAEHAWFPPWCSVEKRKGKERSEMGLRGSVLANRQKGMGACMF